nr:ribosome-inactivating protein [Tanacetum cinerariifolium]
MEIGLMKEDVVIKVMVKDVEEEHDVEEVLVKQAMTRVDSNAMNVYVVSVYSITVGADEQCLDGEPTTNIIGMAGKCVDVYEKQYNNGTPIILFSCENAKDNQLWTFKSDGTVRSNGKCLTANGYASEDYIWIFNCDKAEPKATKWVLYNAGTIMNPRSGLVIAAESST